MSYFREKYIKTNIFDAKLSRILTDLYEIRTGSDYDDHYDININELKQHIINTELFYKEIKVYLEKTTGDY